MLLDADYTARLADFGYASLVGNIPEALTYLQRSTARPGALRWIAPEQVDSEETFNRTTKTDIYSFGCIALQESSLTDWEIGPMLMSLQVFSGKQPWSELRGDSAIVLRLAKGHKPGRPESPTLNDSHWNLIQDCWAAIEERPAVEVILSTIQQFLSHCQRPPPLCDLLPARASQDDLGPEPSSVSPAGMRISQASSNEDDESRYVVMTISVQFTILTSRHLHLSGSLRFLMYRAWANPTSKKRRIWLIGRQPGTTEADEQCYDRRRRMSVRWIGEYNLRRRSPGGLNTCGS